ncbi:hypothetical protein K2173_005148 [Erythroxylum novogranatense]|uniref:C2H2-type domain-containing protein n=1 Tax=Erythroxylum novogranatense TaxID=1862640 RepID=A0AAV8TUC8_9ROSI|nr:hypothetical protein K2173_005148 [Erythroxylum novogranatense]
MSNSGEARMLYASSPMAGDVRIPLMNLSAIRSRMDSLQRFLSESINRNTVISREQMDMVSGEISAAIQQIIVNGASLLTCSQAVDSSATAVKPLEPPDLKVSSRSEDLCLKVEEREEYEDGDCEIVELDAVELLAEHVHFCEICGKGFKRDANLRMHMRAHGNQFKTPEALAKPAAAAEKSEGGRKTRFSCPFDGCNRNKKHKKFRPLKSVICVRNHFKRSHCPKMYSCNRCNKKSFSVMADLKSHLKHCGESRWRCSCGTSFSRKDKLFGHMALFEGHMPAVEEEEEEGKAAAAPMEEDDGGQEPAAVKNDELKMSRNCTDNGFFEGLLDEFGSVDGYSFRDVLGSPENSWGVGIEEFCGLQH